MTTESVDSEEVSISSNRLAQSGGKGVEAKRLCNTDKVEEEVKLKGRDTCYNITNSERLIDTGKSLLRILSPFRVLSLIKNAASSSP